MQEYIFVFAAIYDKHKKIHQVIFPILLEHCIVSDVDIIKWDLSFILYLTNVPATFIYTAKHQVQIFCSDPVFVLKYFFRSAYFH